MADTYDLLVLGGGTGGYSCALRAADLGLRVALIEKAKLGGVCLHSGCIPTKALLQAAEVADHSKDAARYGVRASFNGVHSDSLHRYKNRVVDANWKGLQAMLPARGVEVIPGVGRLRDAHTLVVDTEEGRRTVSASRGLVLATGSVPIDLSLPGAETDGERIITSDHALTLPHVPQRPIVIGCGAVGVEFATVWNSLGAEQVTLVEALDGLLPAEDIDTCKTLGREFEKRGMRILTSTTVTGVEKGADGVRITVKHQGGEERLEGDVVMVAVGRRPVTEGMGFEEAGVTLERGYVDVDEYFRTSADRCYAIGDVIPTLGLAHASFQEGFVAAEHAAGGRAVPIDYAGVPRVAYCHPEVASVGWTEQRLRQDGLAYDAHSYPYLHNARAMMTGVGGHVKVLAGEDGGPVLGIHIVGPKATELIAEGQLIYNWQALPSEVGDFIHPHPTLAEALGEANLALAGKPLHG